MIIFLLFVFVIGIIIYKKNKGLIPCYWLLLETLFLPIVAFVDNARTVEDVNEAYGKLNQLLFLLVFILLFFEKKLIDFYNRFGKVIYVFIILCIFQIIWGLYHDSKMSAYELVYSQRYFFMVLFVPAYLFSVKETTPRMLSITLLCIVLVEVMLAIVNHYFNIHLYTFQYLQSKGSIFADLYTSGTFRRFSVLAAFLAVFQSIIASEYFLMRRISRKLFWSLSIISFFILLLTGSRNGLFAAIITFFFAIIMNFRNNTKYLLIFIALALILLTVVFSLSTYYSTKDADNGIDRNLYGLAEKLNKKSSGYGEGTDNLNYELIDKYYTYNPLGRGATANRTIESAYKNKNALNDSQLVFRLVEYGWVYFIMLCIYCWEVFSIYVKGVNKMERYAIINVLFTLLLLTITDVGVFDYLLFCIFGCYAYSLKYRRLIKPNSNMIRFYSHR